MNGFLAAALSALVLGQSAPGVRHSITLYPIPAPGGANITLGPDKALWFSEGGSITRIDTQGNVKQYDVPGSLNGPQGIVTGPDGALWFAGTYGGSIGRITTAGHITAYQIPSANAEPSGITVGSDGNLWFTEQTTNKIGKLTTAGKFTEYPIPDGSAPSMIVSGPDGALWFTGADYLARVDTSGNFTVHDLPAKYGRPVGLTVGTDQAFWFTWPDGNAIGRMTMALQLRTFGLPASTSPFGIATGPRGYLWFADKRSSQIGRIRPDGQVRWFQLPPHPGTPQWIALGPDRAMWFTCFAGWSQNNVVGRIDLR